MNIPFSSEHRDDDCHASCCGGPVDGCECDQCHVEDETEWTDEERARYAHAMGQWHQAHRTRIPKAGS